MGNLGRSAGLLIRAGVVILALCAQPCFAGKVQSIVGQNAEFSRYKTYQWLPTRILTKTGVVEDEPSTTPVVKDAINRQLAAKGLREVNTGGDLQVATVILTESTPQLEALIFSGVQQYDWGQPIATVGRYNKQGTLVVNLIDAKTTETAFAGMATKSIDNKPGAGIKKIPQAVADVFKKYPAAK